MEPLVLPLLMYKEEGSVRAGTKKQKWVVPSWNHLYIIQRNRPILDQWAMDHKMLLISLTQNWARKNKWKMTENRKIIVNCTVYFPDAIRRDLHNLDKLVLDAFNGIIYDDDCNCLLRYIDFDLDLEDPRMEFTFEPREEFDRKNRKKELEKLAKDEKTKKNLKKPKK